jgi:hypothetical protein
MNKICYIEFQMTDSGMEEVFRDDHAYEGPWKHCGGGPSAAQNRAADSNAALSTQMAGVANRNQDFVEKQQAKVNPFYTDMMQHGPSYTGAMLDYSGGTNARAFAPAKANLMRRLAATNGLPSGYRDQALTDFDTTRAHAYDDSLSGILADQQATRERGASGLIGQAQVANPMAYYSGAAGANQSIMNANLRKPGMAGIIGGVLGGASSAFA